MKAPLIPGCVCLRGVWILQTSICGNKPIVIVGKSFQDCYYIGFNITAFIHLGDPSTVFRTMAWITAFIHLGDPSTVFRTMAWVAPYHLTTFYPIPEDGSWTPYLDFDNPVIIAINAQNMSYEAEERFTCFRSREVPQAEPVVHVWMSALPKTRYRSVGRCWDPVGSGYDEFATVSNFYYHGNDDEDLPILGCRKTCDIYKDGKPKPDIDGSAKRTYAQWLEEYQKLEKDKKDRDDHFKHTLDSERKLNPMFGRKRRSIVNCEMVWEGRAFCMNSYWEPVEKIHMTEREKKLCYPPQSSSPPIKRPRYG
ncbi:unnamed protein product [Allacma fusca]|uniref:Uncharacterized protein n=1 Tax=Allacma fusca TaxID=39272 RepID=A0A8J2PLR8_9HEXA|nr:unnamed protein product [Allacma fusca]